MTNLYRYYCADTDCGRHFCLMAKDDMEAAYRADSMAKDWYNTTLNCKTGKVKEYSYQVPKYAKRKLKKIIESEEDELILCTHDHIQHLKPEKYITENDKKNFYSK